MHEAPFTSKRWRRVEYERLVDAGAFNGEPLELISGQLIVDDESAPEPDLAVVRGALADFRHAHPARPALVIEVAESSLQFDRVTKGSLYARAGIADYWIVNLIDRVVEIYRDPAPDLTAPFGWRYAFVGRFRSGDSMTPLDVPATPLAVAALLP